VIGQPITNEVPAGRRRVVAPHSLQLRSGRSRTTVPVMMVLRIPALVLHCRASDFTRVNANRDDQRFVAYSPFALAGPASVIRAALREGDRRVA
jgi:hypothetical protein